MTPAPRSTLRTASARIAVRRHALAARVSLASLGVFAGAITLGVVVNSLAVLALPSVALTVAMLLYARHLRRGGRREAGVLEISDAELTLERPSSRVVVPSREITAGWVVPTPVGASVELLRANGDVITADVSSLEEANAALAAAGIDARRRAVRVLLGGRWDGLGYGLATVLFVLLQGTPMFILFAMLAKLDAHLTLALGAGLLTVACLAGARILGPAEITVGADGVSWRRGFSRGFVAYRDLAAVDAWHGNDIALRRRSGEIVLITHSRRDPSRTAGVVEMIRVRCFARAERPDASLEMLDRAGRSLDAWREALRALVTGRVYRDVALTRDDLARALDDPEVTAERRMGAALALVATGDPDGRTRVRVAAEACASDTLRDALQRIARDEVDEGALSRAARRG